MNAHTPGPWRLEMVEDRSIKHLCPVGLDNLSLLTIVQQDGTPFAAVFADADACLIAAAPDLLAVCQRLAESAAYWSEYDVPLGIAADLQAAIGKATGVAL